MSDKGVHYIVNAYGCEANLDNVNAVKQMLNELVEKVGMKKLSEPIVVFHNADNKQNSGVTGIVLLSESHISIHTFSNRKEFYMDIFSCRPFDTDIVKNYINEMFKIEKLDEQTIRRGMIL